MIREYFTYTEAEPDALDRCIIVPKDYDNFPMNIKKGGSYNVAPARVLGLDYPTYLRFLRDSFGDAVKIEGRNSLYVVPYWRKGPELHAFIRLLNARLILTLIAAEDKGEEKEE